MSIIIFNDKTPQPFVHQKPHVLVEFNRFLGKSIYLGFYLFLDQGINLFVFSSLKILIGISSHKTSWLCNENLPTITICFDNITKITRTSYFLNLISKEMFVVVYKYTGERWQKEISYQVPANQDYINSVFTILCCDNNAFMNKHISHFSCCCIIRVHPW